MEHEEKKREEPNDSSPTVGEVIMATTGVVTVAGVVALTVVCPPVGILFGLGILNRLKVRGKI